MENLNFNNVYNTHYKDVLKMVTYKLGAKNKELAEELTNDVFLRVDKHIKEFDSNKSTVRTWLFHIAKNLLKDQWRRKDLNPLSIEAQLDEDGHEIIQLETNAPNPYEVLVNEDLGKLLTNTIDSLPDGYKELSRQFFIEQYSYEEIVHITNLPLGTVKGKLFRARQLLQEVLS